MPEYKFSVDEPIENCADCPCLTNGFMSHGVYCKLKGNDFTGTVTRVDCPLKEVGDSE